MAKGKPSQLPENSKRHRNVGHGNSMALSVHFTTLVSLFGMGNFLVSSAWNGSAGLPS
ncbi:hypothetical protein ZHAS_00012282 [Anopheles sinensis]|uniref:Uncharacterized protein n=1 Tax=Anopheles sinensis TaxID=74873 RepID=A0A084W2A0_ANOSI|nr:hypothetical protein ZHAS_00012282 [Anopheles sinensis]